MKLPIKWEDSLLEYDASISENEFRAERLGSSDEWEAQYRKARKKFENLFERLSNFHGIDYTDELLTEVFTSDYSETIRYLAGPPISDDDLKVVADIRSLAPGVLKNNPEHVQQLFQVVEKVIDPFRFPWLRENSEPTTNQIESALLASSVLLAGQRIATSRRSSGKNKQEGMVREFLASIGFEEVDTQAINTIVNGPAEGQFCAECQLGARKADVVVRLKDTRLLAIECKVSNSSTNSVKRLNNDAAVKAEYWLNQFGQRQVVPAAVLSGVFKPLNLKQAQDRGLSLFWSHDLEKLGEFISSIS